MIWDFDLNKKIGVHSQQFKKVNAPAWKAFVKRVYIPMALGNRPTRLHVQIVEKENLSEAV